MNVLSILSAVICVDFLFMIYIKYTNLGEAVNKWYLDYGLTAVISDCLIIVLGIMLTYFLFPDSNLTTIVIVSLCIQMAHDYLFYLGVIRPLPQGTNRIIDLFKQYSQEHSWKILVADGMMVVSTVVLADYLANYSADIQSFVGLLALYSTTYLLYTKPMPK